ncbi:hypothetical protein [Pseudomonas boanensis]|uniref:hypothetical protein n=1 Tax=Metapseudomonas boanensis TaxID=2822138 RepID=UPI0035D422E0
MNRLRMALMGIGLGLAGAVAQAEPMCDCSKVVGQCAASIKMKSLTGSKPSFTANYTITSTTATCSKVSYYIDGTPYFNVLANTNTVEDSTFGTSPISMKSFSGLKCEVCASNTAQLPQQGGVGAQPVGSSGASTASAREQFNGAWRTDLYVLRISNASAQPQIGYHFDRTESGEQGSADGGKFEGDVLVYSWSMGLFGRNSCRFRVTGSDTAVASCSNFTGSHVKNFTRM